MRRMEKRLKPRVISAWVATALLLVVLFFHPLWLTWLGESIVCSEQPEKTDLIVVLGGDASGNRLLKAAELCLQGYAKHVLVSGPYIGDVPESEGSIPDALEKGYPWELFISYPHHATSTMEEAFALSNEFERLGVRRILVVTSTFHSRRASLVFRALLPDFQLRFIAVPETIFSPDSWWKSRDGRRIVVSEWSKIMGTLLTKSLKNQID
jgi:uncharacterized SAM-binding protein YcdF (DUF218 family)